MNQHFVQYVQYYFLYNEKKMKKILKRTLLQVTKRAKNT